MRVLLCVFYLLVTCVSLAFAQPEIRVNIPAFKLLLIENDQIIKEYNIAVGTPYEQTPTGAFKIFYKEQNPTWIPGSNFNDHTPVPPGPENPLGTRWMEFKTNYGIHGTNKGWDISYPVSGGCLRMQDSDAREIYELVQIGTPVIITYETLLLIEKPDGLYLKAFPDIYNRGTNTTARLLEFYQPYASKYPNFKIPQSLTQPIDTPVELKLSSK
ncbi:L,D-transpeptidase [Dendrosporobacter sp. 1207_IL3150]|uniref:L,D-transpeptidase n=1 Tax=Dendrosporobacter sp. 1207_IL3150 TaxID=3084054 RepID=UPI002FDB08E8